MFNTARGQSSGSKWKSVASRITDGVNAGARRVTMRSLWRLTDCLVPRWHKLRRGSFDLIDVPPEAGAARKNWQGLTPLPVQCLVREV